MTKQQKHIGIVTSAVALFGFTAWLYFEPSFEPAIGVALSLGGLLGSRSWTSKYRKSRLSGRVAFDYSNNDGKYTIGAGILEFETNWSKGSKETIHLYNDPANIKAIAYASGKTEINDIENAEDFDYSSRARTIGVHKIALLQNIHGNYAALKVVEIHDNTRGDTEDKLIYEYVINPDKATDFSQD